VYSIDLRIPPSTTNDKLCVEEGVMPFMVITADRIIDASLNQLDFFLEEETQLDMGLFYSLLDLPMGLVLLGVLIGFFDALLPVRI
jgi:hypothetical protein